MNMCWLCVGVVHVLRAAICLCYECLGVGCIDISEC